MENVLSVVVMLGFFYVCLFLTFQILSGMVLPAEYFSVSQLLTECDMLLIPCYWWLDGGRCFAWLASAPSCSSV